jgi:site-specific DNA-cytosine methylase
VSSRRLRVLELFCGLGGIAAALGDAAEVAAAIDIDRPALAAYRANFPHPTRARTLESVPAGELAAFAADLWTLAPPCQPYTRRGLGHDLEDPRAAGFSAVLTAVAAVRPRYLFLENVPGFCGSRGHALLLDVLGAAGYTWRQGLLCPSDLGWPNRRRRFYLLAAGPAAGALAGAGWPAGRATAVPPAPALAALLDPAPAAELAVPAALARRYRHALDVVRPGDPAAITACFTSAYGRSPVRSGSYLAAGPPPGDGGLPPLRRFSPGEVLRLLGFPTSYRLPPDLPRAKGWRLAGNSLSLPAVRHVLAALPELADRLPANPSPRLTTAPAGPPR